MAKTNVNDQHQPLPEKIERRLAELQAMGEFGQDDISHCRCTYWDARADWHKILVDCYEMALQRQQGGGGELRQELNAVLCTRGAHQGVAA